MDDPTAVVDGGDAALPWRLYAKRSRIRPGVEAKLREIISQGELTIAALVVDSSGMDHQVRRRGDGAGSVPFGTTRWSEAALHLEELLRLASACGLSQGIDVHFTNRSSSSSSGGGCGGAVVTSVHEIRQLFEIPPKGTARLNELVVRVIRQYSGVEMMPWVPNALRKVLRQQSKSAVESTASASASAAESGSSHRVLLVLITCSSPADGGFARLYELLKKLPERIYVTLVNCYDLSEDDSAILLWEQSLPRYHGQSYYAEELSVATRAAAVGGGPDAVYDRAAYVQDMVLGPFYPEDAAEVRKRAKKVVKWRAFKNGGVAYGLD